MLDEDDTDEDDEYRYERDRVRRLLTAAAGGAPADVERLLDAVWWAYEVPHDDAYAGIALAVPYLVKLLDVPGVDRTRILRLLTEVTERSADPEHPGWLANLTAAQAAVTAATPTVQRLAADTDAGVRAWAATLLGRVATDGAVATLHRLSGTDPNPAVRAAVTVALADLGVPVADRLDDPAPLPRFAAAVTGATTPADLRRALAGAAPGYDELPRVPSPAPHLCERLADRPDLVLDGMEVLLGHPDTWIRDGTVRTAGDLLRAWRPAVRLVPALVRILAATGAALTGDGETAQDLRRHLVFGPGDFGAVLSYAGGTTPDATDGLATFAALHQHRSTPGNGPLRALCRLRDPRIGRYVAEQLTADEPRWLELEFDVLPRLGPWAAATCGPALLDHVRTAPDGVLRFGVVEALGRVTAPTDAAVAEVVDAVRNRIGSTGILRWIGGLGTAPDRVARVLDRFGPAAADALPDLHALRDHDDPGVRLAAALAVHRIDLDPALLLAELGTGLGAADPRPALDALAEIGPAGAGFAEQARTLLRHQDAGVAARAAVAYWRVTGAAEPVVPVLVRALGDVGLGMRPADWPILRGDPPPTIPDGTARTAAVRCLGEIGPAAAGAVALLRTGVGSDRRQIWGSDLADTLAADDDWRRQCADALFRIDPPSTED